MYLYKNEKTNGLLTSFDHHVVDSADATWMAKAGYTVNQIARVMEKQMVVCFFKNKEIFTFYFLEQSLFNLIGEEYITRNTKFVWSPVLENWFASLSLEAYYNDETRNPVTVKKVEYIGETVNGQEIYRDIESKIYYTREASSREPFASWLSHGRRLPREDSGDDVRPNIVFAHNGQYEKVQFTNWKGRAVASGDNFNKNFSKG